MNISLEKSTVNKIIAAAIPLFATKGFAAVSVKELAENAGVNIALISYYFGGKEKLYTFILNHHVDLLKGLLDEIKASGVHPVEKIKWFLRSSIQMHNTTPYLGQLIIAEKMNPTQCAVGILHEIGCHFHHFLTECIQEAMEQGAFRRELHPGYAALALHGIIHVSFCWQHHSGCLQFGEEEAEDYLSQGLELYFHGIMNRNDPEE